VSLYLITYNLLLTTELLNNYELLRVAYKCFREQFPIISIATFYTPHCAK